MKTFVEQARIYSASHKKDLTKYTHFAGVPLVILSFMIFLGFFQLLIPGVWQTNFATLGTVAVLIYYFILNWRLALTLTPIMFFLLLIASFFNYAGPTASGLWAFVISFVLGMGLQLAGHFIEGKRPTFMDNLVYPLIAPMYLTAEVYFMFNWLPGLRKEIYNASTHG